MINLSDTTPAAPTGASNIKWQQDSSGNVSAYTPTAPTKATVAPSAGVLTLDASLANSFLITVNQAITSMSIVNPTDGQEITLLWAQDTSGHAVTLAANLLGAAAVTTTANKHTCQRFSYNVGDTNWYATSPGQVNM
jgi:hypothetical protein